MKDRDRDDDRERGDRGDRGERDYERENGTNGDDRKGMLEQLPYRPAALLGARY
jgi:hypothetical protein